MKHKKRILAYFYHCQTLGHSRRILNLCHELQKSGEFEIVLVSGGEYPTYFKDGHSVEILQLPTLVPEKNLFEGHRPKNLSLPLKSVMGIRREMLKSLCREYKPDLILCEFFPFGRFFLENEIRQMVKVARSKKPDLKVFSCMRDIWGINLGEGQIKRKTSSAIISDIFDKVLIHGDEKVNDFVDKFDKSTKKKFHFTGYVVRDIKPINQSDFLEAFGFSPKKPVILVSVGGGKDGKDLIFRMGEVAKATPDLQYLFLLGPYHILSGQEKFSQNVVTSSFEPNYPAFIPHANLLISMSGYNTMSDVLQFKTANLVFPRESEEEQVIRAQAFKKLGICEVLDTSSSAKDIVKAMRALLLKKRFKDHSLNIQGAAVTVSLIQKALREKSK